MAKHFYDLINDIVIDPKRELRQLCHLFSHEKLYDDRRNLTLEKYIDKHIFRTLSFRGTFITVEALRAALSLTELDFALDDDSLSPSISSLFIFCEFLLGLAVEGEELLNDDIRAKQQMNTIFSNILTITDRTNHEVHNVGNEEQPRFIIVEKNKLASQAREFIDEQFIALAVIEYNHYSLRGNANEKRRILTELANYVEPILKSNILRENGFAQLQNDTGFILNNFHIRHNNKTGVNSKEYVSALPDTELEKWYDKAYNLMLSVIVEAQNIRTHHEIEQLKQSYKW